MSGVDWLGTVLLGVIVGLGLAVLLVWRAARRLSGW